MFKKILRDKCCSGVAMLLLSLIALAFFVFSTINIRADLSFFLPKTDDPTLDLLINRLQNNPQSGLVLMALEGQKKNSVTDKQLIETSKKLRIALEKENSFQFVLNDNKAILGEVQEFLFKNRYLLAPVSTEDFSVEGLKNTLKKSIKSLAGSEGIFIKKYLPHDPSLQFFKILNGFKGNKAPPTKNGVWFSKDEHRALLMLQMKSFSGDVEKQKEMLSHIKKIFRNISPKSDSIKLLMTGSGVFSAETGEKIKKETMLLSVIATIAVAAILIVFLRSFNLFLLVGIPLLAGVLSGVIVTQYFFGYIHGITLAFGITIIGIAIDYPLHLIYHKKNDETAKDTIKRIWSVLLLGVLTTSLGYSAITFSHFPGLSQLGVFAISGLITSVIFTRFILPPFIKKSPPTSSFLKGIFSLKWFNVPLKMIFIFAGIISILALFLSPKIWEDDIAHLSPISQKSIDLDRSLRNVLGAPDVRHMVVVTGKSEQDVLEKSEELIVKLDELKTQGVLRGYEMAAKNMPSIKSQKERINAIPSKKEIISNMREALKSTPFKPNTFKVFLEDIKKVRRQKTITIDSLPNSILKTKINNFIFEEKIKTTEAVKIKKWIGLVLLNDVENPESLKSLNIEGKFYYFDFKESSNQLIKQYQREAFLWLFLGFAIVCVTLFIFLRKDGGVKSVFSILFPIVNAMICSVAILVFFFGISLSLFHIVALLLVFGIGLDYALFFVIHSNKSIEDRMETGRAVAVCATTTLTVFAILSSSSVPILKGIGLTVSVGVITMFLSVLSYSYHNKRLEK